MFFIILLLLTAFLMEGIGTYVSIIGLAITFAGDPIILAIAGVFDLAKVVTVSFLYQNWEDLRRRVMPWFMVPATAFLILLTSVGVYGYLVKSFQEAVQPNMQTQLELKSVELEVNQLTADLESFNKQKASINKQVEQLPTDKVTERQRLLRSFNSETQLLNKNIAEAQKQLKDRQARLLELRKENVKQEAKLGPLSYTAQTFNIPIETAVKWLVLAIIFVFDPLAVMLLIAGNYLIKRRNKPQPVETMTPVVTTSTVSPAVWTNEVTTVESPDPAPAKKPRRRVKKPKDPK